ncbi:GNAT family N-acetyltransferase [Tardiphaga sp. 803_E3_N1_3]|jgi:GNAT superfamily N-acetyltransferase|uniref:GNAT family N-acetyltransferase n=1 Tax=unclassified Tardiphaga TaxID=2631404 RepID=UPI00359A0D51
MNSNLEDIFIDKKGREIQIDVSDDIITAYHNDKEIGEFTLRIEDDSDEYFQRTAVHADVIDIDKEFQNAGIGSEMLRRAYEHHGIQITPPDTYYPNKSNRNTMSGAGYSLMRRGQSQGWVGPFSDQLPDDTDDFDSTE